MLQWLANDFFAVDWQVAAATCHLVES